MNYETIDASKPHEHDDFPSLIHMVAVQHAAFPTSYGVIVFYPRRLDVKTFEVTAVRAINGMSSKSDRTNLTRQEASKIMQDAHGGACVVVFGDESFERIERPASLGYAPIPTTNMLGVRYRMLHSRCPKCIATEHERTCIGHIRNDLKTPDPNTVRCACGWSGGVHELTPFYPWDHDDIGA